MMAKFKLSENYIEKFKDKKPPFGFNGLGEITYLRTYSRIKDDGNNEVWWETVRRVVEGTYNMQKDWIEQHQLGWNPHRAQKSAQEMFDRMFSMKFLPPGRGLWAMGSAITEERKMYAALNNCAFVSTDNLNEEPVKPFLFMMDMSMLGVGVGFGVEGAGKITIKGPNPSRKSEVFEIPDSREGWVDSLKLLLESYFHGTGEINFDYSKIRAAGLIIKGFGGKTSGPEPLKLMHEKIKSCLDKEVGQPISITTIVDIMNLIGVCVVAGNVRRTAEIVFGPYSENEYLDLKNYKVNPERSEWGWTSNNSIFCDLGMDYKDAAERTKLNGEPGYAWLENMKSYSRMKDAPDDKDHRVTGGNPCVRGDTLIPVLSKGYARIDSVVGQEIETWNGFEWTKVTPKITGYNQPMLKVTLNNGKYLVCTHYHKWYIDCPQEKYLENDGNQYYEKEAKDLKVGDSLYYFGGISEPFQPSIVSIDDAGVDENVYCFNEPKRHLGCFNGIITGQCLEQSLESFELCCLVETFPHNCESLEDYLKTLKYAYLYAKTVTLGKTHWAETNRVMLRNRRIGCSMSGIAQFVGKNGLHTFKRWCEEGYKHIEKLDEIYSDWFAIPKSIKKTSIKPSGTVSLLAGATPGMHWPESRFYTRRVRLSKYSDLIQPLTKSGYYLEPSATDPENTLVVEIPVDIGEVRPVHEVSIWEQMSMAAFLQKYWADNQVSCTVTFNPEKEGDQIEKALNFFQYQLKGISFLPKLKMGAYKQMPYEEITEEQYNEKNKNIKKLKIKSLKNEEANVEVFCDTEKCELRPVQK